MEIDNHLSSFSPQNSCLPSSVRLLLRVLCPGRNARTGSCSRCAAKRETWTHANFLMCCCTAAAAADSRKGKRDKRDVAAAWHVFNSGAGAQTVSRESRFVQSTSAELHSTPFFSPPRPMKSRLHPGVTHSPLVPLVLMLIDVKQ